MPIEIEVPADNARLNRLMRVAFRRRNRIFQAVGVLFVAWGIAWNNSDLIFIRGLLIGYGALLIAYPWIVNRVGGKNNPCNQASHVTVDESGVVSRTATSTGTFTWAAFRRAEITRTDVVLLLNRGFLGIPLDGLRPADQERLVGLMAAHGLVDSPR